MVQGEPEEFDEVFMVENIKFSIEKELAENIKFVEIDYFNGWLRKGFAVYPNGIKNC